MRFADSNAQHPNTLRLRDASFSSPQCLALLALAIMLNTSFNPDQPCKLVA
jgi:hypothetical protein